MMPVLLVPKASNKLPTIAAVLLLLLLVLRVNGACVAVCKRLLVVTCSRTFSKPRCCPVVCGAPCGMCECAAGKGIHARACVHSEIN